ncbi:ubiquitin-associated domain-containing protein 1 isoform X4 [Denticeps clupeoides]|uniref:ubiquitin-associated domain-containing protein 1 isoform X4 n=1 Tax=Denticeps clupeoides TaxID=299321 RepID=UPI0010A405F5|nr:ubiquitin-associated domain-containing protein 1 isoform X4 [Denticeps clupeoides]
MFVQEEKIFAGKVLKIHVCTMDGTEWLEEVTEDTTIEKLKEKCLKHYVHGSLEDPKTLTHHKLIHAASERILTEVKTVADENLKDKDVLLLIKKRPPPTPPKMSDIAADEKKKQESKAPDKEAILKATASLSTRHTDRTVTQHNIRDQFQTELRKILVSLIEVAQKLLALNPDAVELFKKANAMLDEDEEERVDEAALQQLTEMGFPESRAIKALRLNHMSVTQAMDWLIEHVDDPTADIPLIGQDTQEAEASAAATSAVSTAARHALLRTSSQSSTDEAKQDELTEIFKRIRRKREFRPDSRAVIALMEMGFDEKEVIDALRVNNNQQDAAAILENPVVQLGLTNPKTLLAFEDMLENPLNSTQWMNDPETGPVMLQISRIFQTLNRT